jgi:endoglucanase
MRTLCSRGGLAVSERNRKALPLRPFRRDDRIMSDRPIKISFGQMRGQGLRGILVYSADCHCSHPTVISTDRWSDGRRSCDFSGLYTDIRSALRTGASALVGAIAIAAICWVAANGLTWAADNSAAAHNRLLGGGINLGAALEAPNEGAWGVTLKPEYFRLIKQAGFNSVRVPICWSAHAATQPPYAIEPSFFARIDWVINQALSNGLVVILDLHHYSDMNSDPDGNLPRLVGIWNQIAERYRNSPDRVYFELFNEPSGSLTDPKWQGIMLTLLHTVRQSNPTRTVIIGPAFWNSLDHLGHLELPSDDKHIIVTFHYYEPVAFTHQEASWIAGSENWKGTPWKGNDQDRAMLARDFDRAAAWAAQNDRPLFLGEFGSYQAADMESRTLWTRAVVEEAKKHGFSWSYWEFCSNFGVYDPIAMAWRTPLLQALIGGLRGLQ